MSYALPAVKKCNNSNRYYRGAHGIFIAFDCGAAVADGEMADSVLSFTFDALRYSELTPRGIAHTETCAYD